MKKVFEIEWDSTTKFGEGFLERLLRACFETNNIYVTEIPLDKYGTDKLKESECIKTTELKKCEVKRCFECKYQVGCVAGRRIMNGLTV